MNTLRRRTGLWAALFAVMISTGGAHAQALKPGDAVQRVKPHLIIVSKTNARQSSQPNIPVPQGEITPLDYSDIRQMVAAAGATPPSSAGASEFVNMAQPTGKLAVINRVDAPDYVHFIQGAPRPITQNEPVRTYVQFGNSPGGRFEITLTGATNGRAVLLDFLAYGGPKIDVYSNNVLEETVSVANGHLTLYLPNSGTAPTIDLVVENGSALSVQGVKVTLM